VLATSTALAIRVGAGSLSLSLHRTKQDTQRIAPLLSVSLTS
jgi:hypothetical protein